MRTSKLIDTDVDVVLLCTTPHYRPAQLRAAVEAGKHVFCEKPVAVDPVGVRSVLETTDLATKKGLNIVSGLCWRYDHGVRATIGKILDGAIGDMVAIHENYLTGTLWYRDPSPVGARWKIRIATGTTIRGSRAITLSNSSFTVWTSRCG